MHTFCNSIEGSYDCGIMRACVRVWVLVLLTSSSAKYTVKAMIKFNNFCKCCQFFLSCVMKLQTYRMIYNQDR